MLKNNWFYNVFDVWDGEHAENHLFYNIFWVGEVEDVENHLFYNVLWIWCNFEEESEGPQKGPREATDEAAWRSKQGKFIVFKIN